MVAMPWLTRPWERITKAAGDTAEIERLEALLRKLDRDLAEAFMTAVRQVQDKVDMTRLTAMIANGNVSGAIDMLEGLLRAGGFAQPFANRVTYQTIFAAQETATQAAATLATAGIIFDQVETEVVDYLRAREMDQIRETSRETQTAIRNTILDGVTRGRNPLTVARDVRASIGLTAVQASYVANYRRNLEELQSRALTRVLRDRRFDPSVARAIAEQRPMSREKIDQLVARYQARWLRHRSEVIARTEGLRAANGGQYIAYEQQVREGRIPEEAIRRFWYHSHDDKVRHSHLEIPKMNPDGVGMFEAFQSPLGPLRFPGDPEGTAANVIGCRCTTTVKIDFLMIERGQ